MKLLDYLMIAGIALIILAGIFVYLYFKSEGIECTVNPIDYYQVKENTSCFCLNNINKLPMW